MLNIAVGIDHSFRECNSCSMQTRDNTASRVVEATGHRVKFRVEEMTIHRQLRKRSPSKSYSLHHVGARGQMPLILRRFLAASAVHLGDEPAGFGLREFVVFQLLPGKVCGGTLQAGVVPQNPAIHVLGIPQWMPSEPFNAELGVGTAGQIYQVEKRQNGTMGSSDNPHSLGLIAGEIRDEVTRFEHYI